MLPLQSSLHQPSAPRSSGPLARLRTWFLALLPTAAKPVAAFDEPSSPEPAEPFNPVRRREIVQWTLAQPAAAAVLTQLNTDALEALAALGLELLSEPEPAQREAMGFDMTARLSMSSTLMDQHTGNLIVLESCVAMTMEEGQLGACAYRVAVKRPTSLDRTTLFQAVVGQAPGVEDRGHVQTVVEGLNARFAALPSHRGWEPASLTAFGDKLAVVMADGH